MKLAAVMYLSNQDEIGYPIAQVIPTLALADEVHLLAGDDMADIHFDLLDASLEEQWKRHRIDHKIMSVGGIPSFMERAFQHVRDNSDADFIAICQADTMLTPESIACSRAWMKPENIGKGAHTYVRIGFLYQNSGTGWGHTLVGRDFKGSFFGDGSGKQEDGSHMDFIGDIGTTSLEIGSLGVDLYYRHQKHHFQPHMWNENWLMGDRLRAMDKGDRRKFIELSLQDLRRRIVNQPLVSIESVDSRFTAVIDSMGLRAECDEVHALVRELGYDR